MIFWKVDEETIRCLIDREEIDDMGYNPEQLSADPDAMDQFLDQIVKESHEYIKWDAKNGIQTYDAKALPGEQFLLTISCTFIEDAINKDIVQIRNMTDSINEAITPERLRYIEQLSGEEKQKAFEALTKDLREICLGEFEKDVRDAEEVIKQMQMLEEALEKRREEASEFDEQTEEAGEPYEQGKGMADIPAVRLSSGETMPFAQRIFSFETLDQIIQFSKVLKFRKQFPSALYKDRDMYVLVTDFRYCKRRRRAVAFILAATEYGAIESKVENDIPYLTEHAQLLIEEDALRVLYSLR